MVASALIRCPLAHDFAQPIEDLRFAARFFCQKVMCILHHELKVDLVFICAPPSSAEFFFVNLQAELFDLVVFRFKAFRTGMMLAGARLFQRFGLFTKWMKAIR